MPNVVRQGDTATGHTDILGNPVTGIVEEVTCAQTVGNGSKKTATANTIVNFPSHAHALADGSPTDFRTHAVKINATGKHRAESFNIAVNGDIVPVADEAGPNASVVATTNDLRCVN
jgi:hypothetical protein